MQRNRSLAILFKARDLRAAKTTRYHGLDAACAVLHRAADRLLHGATERNALLKLLGDTFRNKLRFDIDVTDFFDIDKECSAELRRQFLL